MRVLFDCIFLDVGHDHIGARLGKHRGDSGADAGNGIEPTVTLRARNADELESAGSLMLTR